MTNDDIKALRGALAAGPTPGEWQHKSDYGQVGSIECSSGVLAQVMQLVASPTDILRRNIDAAYIAAAFPDRIARLLDEVERLQAENFALAAGQCVNPTADEGGRPYCKEIASLKAERDAQRDVAIQAQELNKALIAERDALKAELLQEAEDHRQCNQDARAFMKQCDALKADAERYRWLVKKCVKEVTDYGDLGIIFRCDFENYDDVDAAIDAAMRQEKTDE